MTPHSFPGNVLFLPSLGCLFQVHSSKRLTLNYYTSQAKPEDHVIPQSLVNSPAAVHSDLESACVQWDWGNGPRVAEGTI